MPRIVLLSAQIMFAELFSCFLKIVLLFTQDIFTVYKVELLFCIPWTVLLLNQNQFYYFNKNQSRMKTNYFLGTLIESYSKLPKLMVSCLIGTILLFTQDFS